MPSSSNQHWNVREAFSHVLSQTAAQKVYHKSILLKKKCSHATLLQSMGKRKNATGTLAKKKKFPINSVT